MRPTFAPSLCALAIAALAPLAARATRCPTMYIVLDRSASMLDDQKWDSAVAAIASFTRSRTADDAPRQSRERFGLMVFPAMENACAPGKSLVSSDFFTAEAIVVALSQSAPISGATPTGESLEAAARLPELQDDTRPRYVVLITDGVPNCAPTYPSPGDDQRTRNYAVQQVQALHDQAVKTFVVGFGRLVDAAVLDEMAAAGGTARSGVEHGYYEASDEASLRAVFDEIDRVQFGEISAGACDDSCYSNGCPAGQRCVADPKTYGSHTLNLGTCAPDPCAQASCGAGQYCRADGICAQACEGCAQGDQCVDGVCAPDPCYPAGCSGCPSCGEHLVCTPAGSCADDPCGSIHCPADAPVCSQGTCLALLHPQGQDAGTYAPLAGKAAGCSCASSGGLLTAAALLSAPMLRRVRLRRKGSRLQEIALERVPESAQDLIAPAPRAVRLLTSGGAVALSDQGELLALTEDGAACVWTPPIPHPLPPHPLAGRGTRGRGRSKGVAMFP
jgi:hypothetical protein